MVADLSRWYSSAQFDDCQKACLAFTEQFVMDVTTLSDVQVNNVIDQLGIAGLVDFASAVLVIEQRHRLRITWSRVLRPIEAS
jgi:hypothetical protein